MPDFQLHPRLQEDCFIVGDLSLSRLLMMNDSRYPWFILAPRRLHITEIYQLTKNERQELMEESCLLAETMQALYMPDKLNIAAIGNLVAQLHLHHVGRFRTDPVWPAPIWGKLPPEPYKAQLADSRLSGIRQRLEKHLIG